MRALKFGLPVWLLLLMAAVTCVSLAVVRYSRFPGAYSHYSPPADSFGSGQHEILDFENDGFGWVRLSWGAKMRIPFQWELQNGEVVIRPYRPPEDGWMPWCAIGDQRFRFAREGGALRLVGAMSVDGSTRLDDSLRKQARIYSKTFLPVYDWK